MKKIFFAVLTAGLCTTSCSDSYMEELNTDDSKVSKLDPNAQLTTALLQTYGDFSLMDTYRNYITGFTQHFAGGWNVTNYAGAVHFEDDISRRIWDRYYEVSIKNLVDAIHNSEDRTNLNAALRIHRVFLTSVLADTYGDVPVLKQVLALSKVSLHPNTTLLKNSTTGSLPNWKPANSNSVQARTASRAT